MVFQNYALYPHMTVYENMAFALKLRKTPKSEIDRRVKEAARAARSWRSTSAASRRRSPVVSASGSPWAAPSSASRRSSSWTSRCRTSTPSCACRPVRRSPRCRQRLGVTTVYVTHDQVEAMTMGHRVAVLLDGVLQQVDTPRALYDTPGQRRSSPASSARRP